jgi:queuosine biosynthesis protein QueD
MGPQAQHLILEKEFSFDSSHCLTKVPDGHPCANLHGHTWKLVVGIKGEVNHSSGWIIDFKDLKKIVKREVIDVLDHNHLNEVLENPTSENLCIWIWDRLYEPIQDAIGDHGYLYSVSVWETATSKCSFTAAE